MYVDLKQIKELITAMEAAGLKKLSIKEKTGFELQLEMQDVFPPQATHSHFAHHPVMMPHPVTKPMEFSHNGGTVSGGEKEKPGTYITSPMVGTFYSAPSPEDPSFIKVGDRVDAGTVVCIIEAMKVMNEVKAGVSGIVEEVLVDSGHPVEFGSKLFRIV